MDAILTPIIVVLNVFDLIVRGALNVRDHESETFRKAVIAHRLKMQVEGFRDDAEIKVCDDPENEGLKVVLGGNITLTAILQGFDVEAKVWEKLIPESKVSVRDYGVLTAAQMDFIIMDHGDESLTLIEGYNLVKRAYLSNRSLSVDDLAVRFNGILHSVQKGRKVETTGDAVFDRKAMADRWRGLLEQNWMKHIQMRNIALVHDDHVARLTDPGDKEAGKFHFNKSEYTKLHKAWKLDGENEVRDIVNDDGLPVSMAGVLSQILKDREDKANKTKAPATLEVTPLTDEKLKAVQGETGSMVIKTIIALARGETVAEFAALETALIKAETTEGNALHAFLNAAVVATE